MNQIVTWLRLSVFLVLSLASQTIALAEPPPKVTTLEGHTGSVLSVSFSSDGKTLASSDLGKTVKIWDLATGKATVTLEVASPAVVAFSPDGKTLAYCDGADVHLWDVASGKVTTTLKGQAVNFITFSPDGKTLATAGGTVGKDDGCVELWDLAKGKKIASLEHPARLAMVAFSPDGKTLAAPSYQGIITLSDVAKAKTTAKFEVNCEVKSVAFSPDGKTLASVGNERKESVSIRLWDVPGEKLGGNLLDKRAFNFRAVAFSPDGKIIAGGRLESVYLMDAVTGKVLRSFRADAPPPVGGDGPRLVGNRSPISCVVFSADGKKLATNYGWNVQLWDLEKAP